jgi:hypothetical protein
MIVEINQIPRTMLSGTQFIRSGFAVQAFTGALDVDHAVVAEQISEGMVCSFPFAPPPHAAILSASVSHALVTG